MQIRINSQAGKQILLLFAVLPLSLLLLGVGWKADPVAICGATALFSVFGRTDFVAAYMIILLVCLPHEGIRKTILSLFA